MGSSNGIVIRNIKATQEYIPGWLLNHAMYALAAVALSFRESGTKAQGCRLTTPSVRNY